MEGTEFWVMSDVVGQPDFGCRKRPVRALLAASNRHFVESLALKSMPVVRSMKGAEFWLLNRVAGQPGFRCRKRPFRAPYLGAFCSQ